MGNIIGLDGQPLKSKEEEQAAEVVNKSIEKLATFTTPRSVQKAMDILQKNGFGFCIMLINKHKTATQVHHNIAHPEAEMLIHQTIHNHFNSKKKEQ